MCTSTTAVVWGLDRKVFRNLIAGVAASKVDDVEKLLATYPLFSELTDSERAALIDVTVTSMHGSQEKIVQQGDKGDIFYIIKSGSVLCMDEEGDGGSLTVSAGSHGYFGELALINNAPRARTVTTREATELLAITRADFQNLLGSKKDLMQKEACKRVLKTCSLLPGNLSASHIEKICESFELREFTKGQDICKTGDEGHSLFVVGLGEVDVIVNGAVMKSYKIGDYFGEGCLTGKGNKRNATLTVTSDNVMLWELGRDPYKKILEPVNRSIAKVGCFITFLFLVSCIILFFLKQRDLLTRTLFFFSFFLSLFHTHHTHHTHHTRCKTDGCHSQRDDGAQNSLVWRIKFSSQLGSGYVWSGKTNGVQN